MKQVFDFIGHYHVAFDRRKYCVCGNHEYIVWHSKEAPVLWSVSCTMCGRTTKEFETKHDALQAWKQ